MIVPKKNVVVVPHKPVPHKRNGAFGKVEVIAPVLPPKRKSLILRCVDIILADIRNKIDGVKDVVDEEPDGWEDYKRFVELARRK